MTEIEQIAVPTTRGRAADSLLIAIAALAGMATTPASGRARPRNKKTKMEIATTQLETASAAGAIRPFQVHVPDEAYLGKHGCDPCMSGLDVLEQRDSAESLREVRPKREYDHCIDLKGDRLKNRALWLIAAAFLSSPGVVLGAELPIPLGLLSHTEVVTWERDADRYDIVLQNVMPGASYVVSSESTYTPVAAPQAPAPPAGIANFANNARVAGCAAVVQAYAVAVLAATDEFGVATANRTALATAGGCLDDVKRAVEALTTTAVPAGQPAPVTVRVRRKFATTVNVQRLAPGDRDWEIAISTGPGAVWLTMPVLAVVHDEGEEWFGQPDPLTNADGTTEERYRLVREDHGFDVRPGAGVGFFLVPESQRERNFAHSFMAGFGLSDSKTPLLFMAGYSLLIGDHVTLTLGYSATWEPEQLGRYRGVTYVSENLTQDQITDDELVARPFFSIGIDFNGFDLSAGKKAADAR